MTRPARVAALADSRPRSADTSRGNPSRRGCASARRAWTSGQPPGAAGARARSQLGQRVVERAGGFGARASRRRAVAPMTAAQQQIEEARRRTASAPAARARDVVARAMCGTLRPPRAPSRGARIRRPRRAASAASQVATPFAEQTASTPSHSRRHLARHWGGHAIADRSSRAGEKRRGLPRDAPTQRLGPLRCRSKGTGDQRDDAERRFADAPATDCRAENAGCRCSAIWMSRNETASARSRAGDVVPQRGGVSRNGADRVRGARASRRRPRPRPSGDQSGRRSS